MGHLKTNSNIIVWPKGIKWNSTRTPVIEVEENKFENVSIVPKKKIRKEKLNAAS